MQGKKNNDDAVLEGVDSVNLSSLMSPKWRTLRRHLSKTLRRERHDDPTLLMLRDGFAALRAACFSEGLAKRTFSQSRGVRGEVRVMMDGAVNKRYERLSLTTKEVVLVFRTLWRVSRVTTYCRSG